MLLNNIKNWVLDILFPVPDLPQNLRINQTLFCPVCHTRLARNVKICHKNSQYKLGAATTYDEKIVREWIWQLKYRGSTSNAILLSKILINYLEICNLNLETYTVVPLPLSQKRLCDRGFNQSLLIAQQIAEIF